MNTSALEHYDRLIDENNDPVYDPPSLKAYMDKWDGQAFIDAMALDKTKSVLEIGVGTGRLAQRTAPLCKSFHGIDISPKTIRRAMQNLAEHPNVVLHCADFMVHPFDAAFDVIYSSLTFMHMEEKQKCIAKIASLLKPKGIFVLSIDKNQSDLIICGDRKIRIFPDRADDIKAYIRLAGLTLSACMETEFAHIFVSIKK